MLKIGILAAAWLVGHALLGGLTSVAASSADAQIAFGVLGYGLTFGTLQALVLRPATDSELPLWQGWLRPAYIGPLVGGLVATAIAVVSALILRVVSAEWAADALDLLALAPVCGAGLALGLAQARALGRLPRDRGEPRRRRGIGGSLGRLVIVRLVPGWLRNAHGPLVSFLAAHALAPVALLTAHIWLPSLLFNSPAVGLGPMAVMVFVTLAGAPIGGLAVGLLVGVAAVCLLVLQPPR